MRQLLSPSADELASWVTVVPDLVPIAQPDEHSDQPYSAKARLLRAAKRGGVICPSFKLGTGESVRAGRRFTDFTEENLAEFVGTFYDPRVLRIWQSADGRPGRTGQLWVNALIRKAEK